MSTQEKIPGTVEAWEVGLLGEDENFVAVSTHSTRSSVDNALGLQPISIRLQKSLIEDLKTIAELHGLGYQPLVRQALTRFAECEMKRIANEALANKRRAEQLVKQQVQDEIEMRKMA